MPRVRGDRPGMPPVFPPKPEQPDPAYALHDALRDIVEDIEDSLGTQYRITASVEIADGEDRARLFYKRTGEPPRWAIFIGPGHGRALPQHDAFRSAALRWRCAAVRALPDLLVELQKEQRAADESLNEAVRLAAAFREQMQGGER